MSDLAQEERAPVPAYVREQAASRVNTKDVITGALLIAMAGIGLWFNGFGVVNLGFFQVDLTGLGLNQHTLGNARRMGPGYMPMLTFYILGLLGFLVLVIGLRNGPDPLARWTRLDVATAVLAPIAALAVILYGPRLAGGVDQNQAFGLACLAAMLVLTISPGWRLLGWVLAAMALFGLLLEAIGLMGVVALCVVASALADTSQTRNGVMLCALFLCALTFAVFIWGLDIRVPVWPPPVEAWGQRVGRAGVFLSVGAGLAALSGMLALGALANRGIAAIVANRRPVEFQDQLQAFGVLMVVLFWSVGLMVAGLYYRVQAVPAAAAGG